jgi:hypothetical protein
MPSGASHPYLTPNLVKPANPPISLQLSHSLDKINLANVSSRCHSICHNRSGLGELITQT